MQECFGITLAFLPLKGLGGPIKAAASVIRVKKQEVSHTLILSPSLLTSRHSASSSASHIPPLRRKELR